MTSELCLRTWSPRFHKTVMVKAVLDDQHGVKHSTASTGFCSSALLGGGNVFEGKKSAIA